MSAGWLAGGVAWGTDDDCPDCGGPLTETSDHPGVLSIECPGCARRDVWQLGRGDWRNE